MPKPIKRESISASASGAHRWTVPMSAKGITAEILISGPVELEQIQDLKRFVLALEAVYSRGNPGPQPEETEAIAAGDIVQIRPSADPTFGGLVFRVGRLDDYVHGYLLVPHRGGCKEAWLRYKPCEVGKLGTLRWPEAEWGLSREEAAERRKLWIGATDFSDATIQRRKTAK